MTDPHPDMLAEPVTVWRLVAEKHLETAFSGEGARLYGGRWNKKGEAVVYTASSRSLAILEMLVQANPLPAYIALPAVLPKSLSITILWPEDLPSGWQAMPAPDSIRALGSAWLSRGESCVLRIPSVIVPAEWNYLLYPQHPDFAKIIIGTPERLDLDPRLL